MPAGAKHKRDEETLHILREAARIASEHAVQQVHQHRLVLTVAEDGYIVEIAPDGSRKALKKLKSPRPDLPKGMVLAYR